MASSSKFDEIALLKTKLKEYCGLTFEGQRDSYLRQKLENRVATLQMSSITQYYQHLLFADPNKEEWQNLINEVTINETYFFREKQQMDILLKTVMPQLVRSREPLRQIRILSAACANGAEAYSLAILLQNLKLGERWRIEIEGMDINQKNVEAARRAIYNESDLRSIDPLVKVVFFERQDTHYILSPAIAKTVRFFPMNLLNFAGLQKMAPYQVIFCRNVLYYFDIPTRERIIQSLAESLTADGYLFVGQTEFIGELSIPFKMYREVDAVFYKKVNTILVNNKER
jgi:chemotaxis protein methyltransferase CheR